MSAAIPPPVPPRLDFHPSAGAAEPSQSQPGGAVSDSAVSPIESNSALWEEVGLELNGVHNYDPACLELDRAELVALNDEFLAHRKLFGFQQDNVRNQMEHVCFLIQNARDRYGESAYQYLHNRSGPEPTHTPALPSRSSTRMNRTRCG